MVHAALTGINLSDRRLYSRGESEAFVRQASRRRATSCWPEGGACRWATSATTGRFAPLAGHAELDTACARPPHTAPPLLGVDQSRSYQIHRWYPTASDRSSVGPDALQRAGTLLLLRLSDVPPRTASCRPEWPPVSTN